MLQPSRSSSGYDCSWVVGSPDREYLWPAGASEDLADESGKRAEQQDRDPENRRDDEDVDDGPEGDTDPSGCDGAGELHTASLCPFGPDVSLFFFARPSRP